MLINQLFSLIEQLFNRLRPYSLLLFVGLYLLVSLSTWQKYDWNPSAQLNIGQEFAVQNEAMVPPGAVVLKGYEGDLGNGYDGQIFYFFSRAVNNFDGQWPQGFDESYRAPRIGYPLLAAIFGIFGRNGTLLGMYLLNLGLLYFSFLLLQRMLPEKQKFLALFYLLNPFALGSYSVLVSDSVLVSLLIIAYYYFSRGNFIIFSLLGGLAILTKEPALFFLFPLGLVSLLRRDLRRSLAVISTLIYPVAWHLYLRYKFPAWEAGRLTDFIQPLDGILHYLGSLSFDGSLKSMARQLSRLPLLVMFLIGVASLFTGNFKRKLLPGLTLAFTFFMIGCADYFYFWSIYENISRMFTLTIPAMVLLAAQERNELVKGYLLLALAMLALFLVRTLLITPGQPFVVWP